MKELAKAGWQVSFAGAKLPARDATGAGTCERGSLDGISLKARIARLVPKPARTLLGFRRDSLRLAKSIRVPGIDIFHAQNTGCEEAPVAARLAGARCVLGTFHVDSTYDLERKRSGLAHRATEWYSNRCLHMAIAVSEATKRDWVRRSGIPADRVTTIHNGIDPDHFRRTFSHEAARAALGLPQDAIIVGGLGRLDAAKGFSHLIEAAAMLSSDFPNLVVAIAGNGPLREQLEAKAASLGISERVVFLGFQSNVNEVLDAFDVFALSSLCEALPFALLEAMSHELPTVGTTVGGVTEVIVPNETGFLVPPSDAAALARSLRPLLEASELRQRMGKAARERVIKQFHEADMVRKTMDVYREMLHDRCR